MSENQPPYYSIFYKNWRPKPKEPPKERKRKLKTSNNAEKQVKVELVPKVSEVNELLEITPMETEGNPCNWDNLPNELKVMCIEKTDFKTRANLMLSNRHNKMLVESIKSKHQLSLVRFVANYWRRVSTPKLGFAVKSQRSGVDYTSDEYEPEKFMDVLLNANIDRMEIQFKRNYNPMSGDLKKCDRKFSIKSVLIDSSLHHFVSPFLEHCDEHLEQIEVIFDGRDSLNDIRNFLGTPPVIAANCLIIRDKSWDYDVPHSLSDTLRVLLDRLNDQNIGKEIIFYSQEFSWWDFIMVADRFPENRHPTDRIIRLRLQNPSKRVWAWLSEEDYSINFFVSAAGSDAPNIEEIEEKRDDEREEYLLNTKDCFVNLR